jgi:ribosomal protein L35
MKTKKSVSKKVKITKNKKVLRRTTGQNHYNSKENGAEGRAKKKDQRMFRADEKNIVAALPYSIGR